MCTVVVWPSPRSPYGMVARVTFVPAVPVSHEETLSVEDPEAILEAVADWLADFRQRNVGP